MTLLLGRKMRDVITGFTGRVVGYVTYLTGCNQALLTPQVDKEGKPVEAEWFDEQRLEYVDDSVIELDNGRNPGFDKPAPKR